MVDTKRLNDAEVTVECDCGRFTIPLTVEQEKAWRAGAVIQRVAPNLDVTQRELLISGTCGACWELLFGNGDDDEEAP